MVYRRGPTDVCSAWQYWKSNPMYWCDYCKVWMNDNPNARAVHERGIKHKENVEKSKYLAHCDNPEVPRVVLMFEMSVGQIA